MEKQIKEFVQECKIETKKKRLIETKKMLYKLEREMANMSLNYEVGTYIHMLDEFDDLILKRWNTPAKDIGKINTLIIPLGKKIGRMKNNPDIIKYLELKEEYLSLQDTLGEYHKSINEDFRNKFKSYNIPNIFIFQGYIDDSKKISISKNIILPEVKEIFKYSPDTIIYPVYELKSNREYRKFYNRISYKYLEEVTNDFCLELNNKNIGKVKIMK